MYTTRCWPAREPCPDPHTKIISRGSCIPSRVIFHLPPGAPGCRPKVDGVSPCFWGAHTQPLVLPALYRERGLCLPFQGGAQRAVRAFSQMALGLCGLLPFTGRGPSGMCTSHENVKWNVLFPALADSTRSAHVAGALPKWSLGVGEVTGLEGLPELPNP